MCSPVHSNLKTFRILLPLQKTSQAIYTFGWLQSKLSCCDLPTAINDSKALDYKGELSRTICNGRDIAPRE